MLRKGLYNIGINQVVEFEVSYWSTNKFGKKQYSGFINGDENEFWYLPTHQQLTDKLEKIPRGSLVRAKRTTKGGPKEACLYEVQILREPKPEVSVEPKPEPRKKYEVSEINKLIHRMLQKGDSDFAYISLMANGIMSREEVEDKIDLKALCAKHDVDYNQL